ncbi:MAG: RepB family DNA primase [Pseudomonadota bacterium]|nr:RepB family DNA primase [Pseudomonadota bacterium]
MLDLAAVALPPAGPVPPDQAAKVRAWQRQHSALDAPAYRITLVDRVRPTGRDRTHNLGKNQGPDGRECCWTADEVQNLIPQLRRRNARGFDVYVTPIDPDHHYLVVDDLAAEGLRRLDGDGWRPCLVQQSSAGNIQAIIKAPRDQGADRREEQRRANQLVQDLNRTYDGDPDFSGVVHPFRIAGFNNKKPGKGGAITRVIRAVPELCRRAAKTLEQMRQEAERRYAKALEALRGPQGDELGLLSSSPLSSPLSSALRPIQAVQAALNDAYRRETERVVVYVHSQGWPLDLSRVDWAVVGVLLGQGHDPQAVQRAILEVSPDLERRHRDPVGYARRTVENALSEPRTAAMRQEALERQERGQGRGRGRGGLEL